MGRRKTKHPIQVDFERQEEIFAQAAQEAVPFEDAEAVVLLSYGGPRRHEDIVPFLRNATAGRGIPDHRLEEVGAHYKQFGGRSPINEQNDQLRDALEAELRKKGFTGPVLIGNRNWTPFVSDTFVQLYRQGIRKVRAIATSAYGSYSNHRQYREDIERGLKAISEEITLSFTSPMKVSKVGPYYDARGFVNANTAVAAEAITQAMKQAKERFGEDADPVRLIFVTHSIPVSMWRGSMVDSPGDYVAQHRQVAKMVVSNLREHYPNCEFAEEWDLAYCSRSGPPEVPWLEPDINDHLEELKEQGKAQTVVLLPIGFISDHMEVAFDLDTEAKETCEELGIEMVRGATVGLHHQFIAALIGRLTDDWSNEAEHVGYMEPWSEVLSENQCLPYGLGEDPKLRGHAIFKDPNIVASLGKYAGAVGEPITDMPHPTTGEPAVPAPKRTASERPQAQPAEPAASSDE